ncbi:hypothetical protein ABBQ32_14131 [Trebouxia sp. C0010 RCD-2024]
MCKAISASYVPYNGPAHNALRTSLLQEVKDRVDDACAVWYKHGLDITGFVAVSDRWADAQSRPLLNMLLCSPKGHKFLKAIDTAGHEKSGQYIADQMTVVIEKVGAHNVTGVIMDGAANNVNASKIVEDRFPQIFCLHCTAHAVDLALEKIGGLDYFSGYIAEARRIVRLLTNHQSLSALFKSHTDLFLLKPGDTRFYTQYIAVRRLLRCKGAVQKTIVDDEFNAWTAKAKENKDKGRILKKAVLNSALWTALARFCMLLKPLVRLTRLVDSNMPTMSKVYAECCIIEKHIAASVLPEEVKTEVVSIFRERWDKMHSPLHSVGYMLEPQFQGTDFGTEVRTDFRETMKKLLPNSKDFKTAMAEYTKYSNREGVFGDPDIMSLTQEDSEHTVPTYQWWHDHGYETPTLARVAKRVTAMISSAGACERNWSTYDLSIARSATG